MAHLPASVRRPRQFDPATHHPVVEALKHVTSPLSVALYTYASFAYRLSPAIAAWARSQTLLFRATLRASPKTRLLLGSKPVSARRAPTVRHFSASARPLQHSATVPPRGVAARVLARPRRHVVHGTRSPRFAGGFGGCHRQSLIAPFSTSRSSDTPEPEREREVDLQAVAKQQLAAPDQRDVPLLGRPVWGTVLALGAAALGLGVSTASKAVHESAEHTAKDIHTAEGVGKVYDAESVPMVLEHLSDWLPSVYLEDALYLIHDTTGLPWWGSIALATVGLRVLLTPFTVLMLRNTLRLKLIMPRVRELNGVMADPSLSHEEQLEAAAKLKQLYVENDTHPMRSWQIPVLFPPAVLTMFTAIHNVCIAEPAAAYEGTLWFTDLMASDPTWVMPVLSGLTWLWNVEIGSSALYIQSGKLRAATRVVAMAFIPICATLPTGVFIFWTMSNMWEISRVMIMRNDGIRKRLGIPLVSELPKVTPSHW